MKSTVMPFWNHVAVAESPVDQEQTESGIMLPLTLEGDDRLVRAIIIAVGPLWSMVEPEGFDELIVKGATVYFYREHGIKVRDVTLIPFQRLIGYEEEAH